MPRQNPRSCCVHESILKPDGSVETILLDERYTPYSRRGARIENLCGSFTQALVNSTDLNKVLIKTGSQREFFHLHGNVVLNQGKAAFMAVRGMTGLESIARSLKLPSPKNVVHMAVITCKLGKRAQVSTSGLLESTLARYSPKVSVKGRIYEHTNSVCFSVASFREPPFCLHDSCTVPDKNDWTVTGKGMLIIRLIWHRLEWSRDVERHCLDFCDRTAEWLVSCC